MGNKGTKLAPPHVHGRAVAGLKLKQELATGGGAPTFQYFDTTTGKVSDEFVDRIRKGGGEAWQFEGLTAEQLTQQLDTSPDARFFFRKAFPEIPMVQSLPQWRTLATKNKATATSDNVFTNTTLGNPSEPLPLELSLKLHAVDHFGSIDGVADAVVERLRKNKQTTMKNYFKAILGITVVGGISVAVLQDALKGDEDCRLENRTTGDSKFLSNDPGTCTQNNWCHKCCAECKASGSSMFQCPGDTDTEGTDVYVCDPDDVAQSSRPTRVLLSATASEAFHSAKVHAAGSNQSKTVSPTRSAAGDWFTGKSQSCTVCGTCPSADIQLCGTKYNTVSDWMADRAADAGMVVKDLGEGLLDFVPDDMLDPLKSLFRVLGIIVAIMVGLAVLGGTVKLVKVVRRRKKAR